MDRHGAIGEAFLAAAVVPEQWLNALGALACATGSDHAQIIGIGDDYALGFNWVSDMDAAAHAAADRAELVTPANNFRVAAGLTAPSTAIVHEDRYEAVKPQLACDAYLDLCSDLRIPYGCQTKLYVGDGGLVGLALLRSQRAGPTSGETRATFAQVRGAAATAVALQIALERQGHRLIAGSFEAMSVACFVLDRAMAIRAVTPAAEELLREGAVRAIQGRIVLPDPADDIRLATALSSVASGHAPAAKVAVAHSAGLLSLRLHRLPAREWNMGFAPFAILIANRAAADGRAAARALRDGFALTASEAEIALLLRAGQTRDAICAARGISRETLRSHLRALFAKLGVRRETEAIHLLHAFPP